MKALPRLFYIPFLVDWYIAFSFSSPSLLMRDIEFLDSIDLKALMSELSARMPDYENFSILDPVESRRSHRSQRECRRVLGIVAMILCL